MTKMKITKTSKKYAEALFETAEKQNLREKVFENLMLINETLKTNNELMNFLISPIIKTADKKDVINKIFGNNIEETAVNFLYLLSDNSRFELTEEIVEVYKHIYNKVNETVSVKVITAVVMKDYLRQKLQQKLENILRKKVIIDYEVNSDIIAGLVLEVDGTTTDSSIQTKLKNIKKQIV